MAAMESATHALHRSIEDAFRALGVDPEEARRERETLALASRRPVSPGKPAPDLEPPPTSPGAPVKRLSQSALIVLSTCAVEGQVVKITAGQLDRKLYLEVNAGLEAIGGKWSRKLRGHVFDDDPAEALDDVIVNGGFVDRRKLMQFFPTPRGIAELLVQAASVQPRDVVLEPSAGQGAIVAALNFVHLTAVELDPKNLPTLALECSRLTGEGGYEVRQGDFLDLTPDHLGLFDVVVMNPPFSKGQDIAHVLHAFTFLKPGGRLAAVVSGGVGFRQDRRAQEFRAWLDAHGGDLERLPDGSFSASGTEASTMLLTICRS